MNQPQGMTLLQRAVIQRLREAGRSDLADAANANWQHGLRVVPFGDFPNEQLRADIDRANDQAASAPAPVRFTKEWLHSALIATSARFLCELAAIRVLGRDPDQLRHVDPLRIRSTHGDFHNVPIAEFIKLWTDPATRDGLIFNMIIDARGSFLRAVFGYVHQYLRRHGDQTVLVMKQPWYFFLKVMRNLVSHVAHEEVIDFKPQLRAQLIKQNLDPSCVTWRDFTIRDGERADLVLFNDLDCVRVCNEIAVFVQAELP